MNDVLLAYAPRLDKAEALAAEMLARAEKLVANAVTNTDLTGRSVLIAALIGVMSDAVIKKPE